MLPPAAAVRRRLRQLVWFLLSPLLQLQDQLPFCLSLFSPNPPAYRSQPNLWDLSYLLRSSLLCAKARRHQLVGLPLLVKPSLSKARPEAGLLPRVVALAPEHP